MNRCQCLVSMLAILAIVLLNLSSPLNAIDSEQTRSTLRGINGVHVYVASLDPEVRKGGLTDYQIQVDIELKLRTAGIKVLSEKEWLTEEGHPYLWVALAIKRLETSSFYVCYMTIEFRQDIFLTRNPGIAGISTTWEKGALCWGPMASEGEYIRKILKEQADIFINAYLSVNPK